MKYDFLIVGSGLFGSVFAHEMTKRGKKCLVIDKRSHIGGNCYTEDSDGISVHKYGAHIFHTSDEVVWNYVNSFVPFLPFVNSPVANYKGELYNLPFNMNTFYALWGVKTPQEAREKIEASRIANANPQNVEEQALSLVGKDIYEKLIKGYTEKQWGRDAKELPAFIIKRLPVRYTFDNNYFNDVYQGIPKGGYTKLFEALLEGIEVRLNTDFFADRQAFETMAETIVYTGTVDEFFDYCYGPLEYRSLRFETERLETENFQGNPVINYTEREIPYTRIIEHKHFEKGNSSPVTIVTREYPDSWTLGKEPYYPVNNDENAALFAKYEALCKERKNVVFGGRLGRYRYYDMDKVIAEALASAKEWTK
ncbi:MAG: UDP-galactopyranose mutase [Clostridia bacterium]|nr:UDP-galactopyranose mutase [Clostridia bacterium]